MRPMSSKSLAFLIAFAAACEPRPQDEVLSNGVSDSGPLPAPPERGPAQPAWVVSMDGAGPFTPGMSLADARERIPGLEAPATPAEGCDYASISGRNKEVSFLIVEDKLARIDVITPDVPTDKGIRVGDTEDKVRAAYGSNLTVEPHKYIEGHYLIVNNPADTTVALIFETDGTAVTRYRLGTQPVVRWVEGCS